MALSISVVIPLYNKQKAVVHTVQSVLNQTVSDFELIVVDDGSTDNSLAVVKAIKDERVRFIHKENGGVSSARNVGIKVAKGQYVALLDGDDYWDSTFLEEHVGSELCICEGWPNPTLFSRDEPRF